MKQIYRHLVSTVSLRIGGSVGRQTADGQIVRCPLAITHRHCWLEIEIPAGQVVYKNVQKCSFKELLIFKSYSIRAMDRTVRVLFNWILRSLRTLSPLGIKLRSPPMMNYNYTINWSIVAAGRRFILDSISSRVVNEIVVICSWWSLIKVISRSIDTCYSVMFPNIKSMCLFSFSFQLPYLSNCIHFTCYILNDHLWMGCALIDNVVVVDFSINIRDLHWRIGIVRTVHWIRWTGIVEKTAAMQCGLKANLQKKLHKMSDDGGNSYPYNAGRQAVQQQQQRLPAKTFLCNEEDDDAKSTLHSICKTEQALTELLLLAALEIN